MICERRRSSWPIWMASSTCRVPAYRRPQDGELPTLRDGVGDLWCYCLPRLLAWRRHRVQENGREKSSLLRAWHLEPDDRCYGDLHCSTHLQGGCLGWQSDE